MHDRCSMGRDDVSLQGHGALRLAGEGVAPENTAGDWGPRLKMKAFAFRFTR